MPHPARVWPLWPLKALLTVLFLGPIIAPLFQATGLPLIADSGTLARDLLATYVCPTPAKSYMLLGHPMAVCARCWGATIGLWLAFLLTTNDGRWRTEARLFGYRLSSVVHRLQALAWPLRLALAALPFGLWVLEITRWASAPLWLLVANGALAGCAAGLFFCSIWPGLLTQTASASRS